MQPNAPALVLRPRQRLTVLFVDLVESVRLYEHFESETMERWQCFVDEVRLAVLPARGGRLVSTRGDSLLMAFDAPHKAVSAAFDLHDRVAQCSAGTAPEAQLFLRAGVHVGDIIVGDDDLYGSAVNLAARIAGLAQPNELLLSAPARDQLTDGLHAELEDLGERYVKHLDESVRVFRASPCQAGGADPARRRLPPPSKDLRPTLAVIPFRCMPADVQQDMLGHAMADDIIAAMARHPGLRVVSRLSTAALRDMALDWTQLKQLLKASYVLSGNYYVNGDKLRLSVELASTEDGEVLWGGSTSASIPALFGGEDDLVPHVVGHVSRFVAAHELARVRSLPMDTLDSYSLYLGAEGLMNSLVQQDFQRARHVFEHLVERHPRQAAPYAMLANWHTMNVVQGWSSDRASDELSGRERAARALDIDPKHSVALSAEGMTRLNLMGDVEGARRFCLLALESDPQDALTWAYLSAVHGYAGEHLQSQAAAARALELSPLDPNRFLLEAYAAMAALAASSFEAAVAHARQSLRLHALHSPSHLLLVGSLWLSNQHEEARRAARNFLAVFPAATAGKRGAAQKGADATWRDHLADALRGAGLP